MNTIKARGWSQIDAIGISNTVNKGEIVRDLLQYGLKTQEVLTFAADKENVGKSINTTYNESKPVITSGGNKLYFSRHNYPENVGGDRDEMDIYVSEMKAHGWSKATNADVHLTTTRPME
ncbi:MAG: hypothetical protein HC842_02000 [Cytophagales bacterium]|nr:hypothetical protein [Cytophagales bacterium]